MYVMIGSSPFGSLDEPISLSGEFDLSGLSGINGYPLFHQPAVAGIEVFTSTSADELIDPFSRSLATNLPFTSIANTLPFTLRTEHLPAADMWVIGKGSEHRHKAGINVAGILLRSSFRELLQMSRTLLGTETLRRPLSPRLHSGLRFRRQCNIIPTSSLTAPEAPNLLSCQAGIIALDTLCEHHLKGECARASLNRTDRCCRCLLVLELC